MDQIKKIILIIILTSSMLYSQNFGNTIADNDTSYRYNPSLKTLDSILKTEVYGKSYIDTSFFRSYGNAESITLEQLIYFALLNNPQIKAMFKTAEAETIGAEEKAFLPDPMFEIELDDIMADFSTIEMYIFSLSQMIMWPGKLSIERQMGIRSSDMMRAEAVVMGAMIINMVKMNYYDLYLNYRMLDINKENLLILQTLVSAAEARYSVGLGMQADVFKAQIELAGLKNEEFILVRDQKSLLNNLSSLTKMNIDSDTKVRFTYDDLGYVFEKSSFAFTGIDSIKLIDYAITNRPEMKVLRNKILMNETSLDMAKISRYPDFELTVGYKILPGAMSNAFRIMVGVTLPFAPWTSGKYDYAIRRNELAIDASLLEFDSMKVRIRNDVLNVLNDLSKSKETMNYYNDVMIPQSENMLKSMQYSYENKMATFTEFLDAYRMLQESREMLIESLMTYLKTIVDLERITGMNIKKVDYGR